MGVSLSDLVDAGNKIGFVTGAYHLSVNNLDEFPLPCILYWRQSHFVVLRKIKNRRGKKQFYIADPAYGNIYVDEEILKTSWMGANSDGLAIAYQHNSTYPPLHVPKNVTKPKSKELIQSIFAYAWSNKLKYFFSIVLLAIGFVTNWVSPIIFKKILDDGILGKSLSLVNILLIAQFVFFVSSFIADFISEVILTKINFFLSVKLKQNFLYKLMRLPVSYFDTRVNTDTLERIGDQERVKTFVTWKGLSLLVTSCNLIVFSIMLYFSSSQIFLIYFLLSMLSFVWMGNFLKRRATIEYSLFLKQSENSNSIYEFIMNMPEIKTQNAQYTVIDRIIKIQHKLNQLELRSLFLSIYQMLGVGFLSKMKEIAALAFCAYFIIYDQMTIGTMLAITYILGQLNGPVQNLIGFINNAQDTKIAYNRLSDVYNEQEESSEQDQNAPAIIREIKLSGVSFKYPGSFSSFVLENINFVIPANKITAIVGTSGSGKTTLLKLLLRQHLTTQGAIQLNDIELNNIHPEKWRDRCGVVSQDGVIFSGTIAFNIALADKNPDQKRIEQAAKIACIDEFIETSPMKYNIRVGNMGIQLSGGQKQRLLIARAVYRNPEFIFFDEATSSLDANNERKIMDNLNTFFYGKTAVIIAHRLSTVKNADQIIVLEKGKIVEKGTHQELVNLKGHYFNLVKNQLELGN